MNPIEEVYLDTEKIELLRLARDCIYSRLVNVARPDDTVSLTDAMLAKRACFVTLRDATGELRGCIGNIEAFEPLADNVTRNAVNAAFHDTRFLPVKSVEELKSLTIEISILTPPEAIASYEGFIPGEHGVILRNGQRGAVFLPQVAMEQGWDRETTLTHLCLKAGLPVDAWRYPETKFSIFRAIVFCEDGH